jgi:O-antigen ligase
MVTLAKTGSRGGFLGFVTVGGYLLLRLRGVSTVQRVVTVGLLATLLVALGSDKYFDRIETILHPTGDYNWSGKSATGRMEIWKRGLGYMVDHPLLGVGAASFGVAEGTLAPEALEARRYGRGFKWSAAHNSFVQIGAELGVGGLILFLALLAGAFRMLTRLRRASAAEIAVVAQIFTATLVAYVVTAFFLSQAYSAYLYTFLGMILGLAKIASWVQPAAPARGVGARQPPPR